MEGLRGVDAVGACDAVTGCNVVSWCVVVDSTVSPLLFSGACTASSVFCGVAGVLLAGASVLCCTGWSEVATAVDVEVGVGTAAGLIATAGVETGLAVSEGDAGSTLLGTGVGGALGGASNIAKIELFWAKGGAFLVS